MCQLILEQTQGVSWLIRLARREDGGKEKYYSAVLKQRR